MGQQDKARDKDLFLEFASVAGLKVCRAQIETPDPPQPDVVAEIEGEGRVTYELGEIIDQDLARNYRLSAETFTAIREFHAAMPPERCVTFDTRFSASNIIFRFSEQADLSKRCRALPAAFDLLLVAGIPKNGRLQMFGPHLENVLESVHILATTIGTGPVFDACCPKCFDPSALSILKKKLTKTYSTQHPLELILHSDQRGLHAETFWLPPVSAHVESHLEHSPFRRVWLFERHPPRVVYVHPIPALPNEEITLPQQEHETDCS
jgi:hypothetical protein